MKIQSYLLIFSVTTLFFVTAEEFSKNFIFPSLPVTVLNTTNYLCKMQSENYIQRLKNYTLWASEMWDATAKSSTGVLRGSNFQMGNFEQCITAEAPFLTKYCLATLTIHIPKLQKNRDLLSLYHPPNEHILDRLYPNNHISQQVRNIIHNGWCIPASCTSHDLEEFLNIYINEVDSPLKHVNVTYTAKVADITCTTKEDNKTLNTADISFCALTIFLILLVSVTTVYDMRQKASENENAKKSFLYRIFISFSARKTVADLMKKDETNNALNTLYGIRTISIIFIIVGHRFGTSIASPFLNFDFIEKEYRAPMTFVLFREDFLVDVFFVMGGLLVTYSLLNHLDKHSFNPGFIILMRYIRLTPVYAFVIFYYATIFNYSGTGPLWKLIIGQDSQDCKDNWWTNILYVNNYVNADHLCMAQSWYLPCDFHYFIIATLICLSIKKNKNIGVCMLIFLTIISIIIPSILTMVFQRPALLRLYPNFLTAPKSHADFLLTYIKSHTRATPYLIGMFTGYIYYKLQQTRKRLSKIKSYVVLLLSILFIIITVAGGTVFYNPYHDYNVVESTAYAGLSRPVFAAGIIGIIYVSSYGHPYCIRKTLIWSPWIPLSKLVYGAYLIHMQFQLRSSASLMNPRYFSYFDVLSHSLSDLILAFFTALVLYLLVETPFRRILKEIFNQKRNKIGKENRESTTVQDKSSGNGTCVSKL